MVRRKLHLPTKRFGRTWAALTPPRYRRILGMAGSRVGKMRRRPSLALSFYGRGTNRLATRAGLTFALYVSPTPCYLSRMKWRSIRQVGERLGIDIRPPSSTRRRVEHSTTIVLRSWKRARCKILTPLALGSTVNHGQNLTNHTTFRL